MAEIDYNEILLEAIDAIVISRISEVNFDRTIVATIVDASKAKDGEYVLSDGSVQFTAHSGNDKYKENDRVNVLIPSNDFSSTEKTILGKTSANANDTPVTYVSPLEKIVPMETNYAAGLKGGIIANSETEIFQLTNAEWVGVNESTLGYDTLCVSARFKTLLNDYDIRQGHYGLLVQLKTKNGYIHALTLDSTKDMFGNPYGYSMYLTQEQTYHLNLQDNIIGIKIDLYQMKDFKYNDGVNSELQALPVMPYSNILVDNINVSFGYNAEQVEDNTVKISTADSLTYDNIKDTSVTKKLTLTWYNKDENNKYLGFADGAFDTLLAAQTAGSQKYYIKWEHSLNNGQWEELQKTGQEQELTVNLNMTWALNEYRAIVVFNGATYTSNIVQFKNATGIDNPQEELQMSLSLYNVEDSSYDSYPLYGSDGVIINPLDSSKNREVYFSYASETGGSLEPDILNGATAYFYIPNNSTMLEAPGGETNWNSNLDNKHFKSGYTAYVKRYTNEFTQYEAHNLLVNTAPKELNGKGIDYNYNSSINNWISGGGNDWYRIYARCTSGGKKVIMLQYNKEDNRPDFIQAKQEVNLKFNTDYTFNTQVWSNEANANIKIELQYIYEDDSYSFETLFSKDGITSNTWVSCGITFSIPEKDKVKRMYICLRTSNLNYTSFYQTWLQEGTELKPWAPATGEYEEGELQARTFKYRIKKNYNPLFTNNNIILKIVDKNGFIYETSKTFAFSSYGTSGTDYSIIITGANGENGWVNSNSFTPKAQLYDANYKEITDIDWAWSKYPTGTTINAKQSLSSTTTFYQAIKAQTTVSWVGKNVQISGICPISYSSNEDYMYQGPTTVIYNSNGIKPSYYDGDLGIFKKSDNSEVTCTWSIEYFTKSNANVSGDEEPWLSWGELTETKDGRPRFKPSSMYLGDTYYLVLVAKNKATILWRQPLIILQNQYASGLLNNWDGNLIVDNKGNYILSSMMGAGKKEDDNTFTGVLMGEIGKVDKSETGLFGYDHGVQSFGFKKDGTAFIGKSGTGRINFDGDAGIIASQSWVENDGSIKDKNDFTGTGLKINLKDGHLNINAANDNHFYFDNNGLDIKVNKLQLTSSLGGANLLQMTAPTADELTAKKDSLPWAYSTGASITAVKHKSSDTEHTLCVSLDDGDANYETLEQTVRVEQGKYYTLSGYLVNRKTDRAYSLAAYVNDNEVFRKNNVPAEGRVYFSHTFYNDSLDQVKIGFKSLSKRTFGIYHAQLEEGTVATAWKSSEHDKKVSIAVTADGITQTVSETLKDYATTSEVDQKASSISLRVEGTMAADFYAETHSDGTTSATTTTKKVKITSPTSFAYEDIFKDGVVLAVRCKYANIKNDGVIKLNIANTSIDPDAGYPIYYNGKETSKDNPFIWDQGAVIYLRYSTTTNPHWDVISGSGVNQLLVNTQGITGTAIERTGTGFKFNLDSSSFRVGPTGGNAVLRVDSDGLYIDGSGTFTGTLKASKIIIQDGADLGGLAKTSDVAGAIKGLRTEIGDNYVTTDTLNALKINTSQINPGPLSAGTQIGGFYITSTGIYDNNDINKSNFFLDKGKSSGWTVDGKKENWRIWAGENKNQGNFGVTTEGKLYAKNAELSGSIIATSGYIGGWSIGTGYIDAPFNRTIDYLNAVGKLRYKMNSNGYITEYPQLRSRVALTPVGIMLTAYEATSATQGQYSNWDDESYFVPWSWIVAAAATVVGQGSVYKLKALFPELDWSQPQWSNIT